MARVANWGRLLDDHQMGISPGQFLRFKSSRIGAADILCWKSESKGAEV